MNYNFDKNNKPLLELHTYLQQQLIISQNKLYQQTNQLVNKIQALEELLNNSEKQIQNFNNKSFISCNYE